MGRPPNAVQPEPGQESSLSRPSASEGGGARAARRSRIDEERGEREAGKSESCWDYPRPPALQPVSERITVTLGGVLVADTAAALRVCETSHPPTYYLPPAAWIPGALVPADGSSFCEWKGSATYWTIVGGDRREVAAGWSYPAPTQAFAALVDHVAVYCARMDRCTVGGEVAEPQPGGFYGGWVTSKVVGPFKGGPGTSGW